MPKERGQVGNLSNDGRGDRLATCPIRIKLSTERLFQA